MFCTITSSPRRLRVLSALMTSSSLSGDFPLLPDFLNPRSFQPVVSQRELICHHFHQHGRSIRPSSPSSHRMLVRISDSQTLPSPFLGQSNHIFACCWHCSDFHGSWRPIPGSFSSWVLGSRAMAVLPSSRPFDTCSSNLLLTPLAGSFSCVAASPWFRVSRHARLLVLVVRWLCPPSPALDIPVSSLSRRFLVFGSSASPALVCFFSPDCEFF